MASLPEESFAREDDPVAGLGLFRDDDAWLEELRRAESAEELGIAGDYELLEEVGRGGQGIVYRARLRGGALCAVKRLLRGAWASEADRRRFEREIAATADLDHPGIVRVLGWEDDGGEPVLRMEWIDGRPVNRWVAEQVPGREPERVLPLFREVCEAVQHAHRNGVIHRDIKPSNVLVDAAGRPHLLDFGLARRAGAEGARSLTLSAEVLGTPSYAAPEQLRAERTVDARADVYSLGVLLWELLTGALPYSLPGEPTGWLPAIEAAEGRRASDVRPGLGRELDTVLEKALAREPARRYASVDALSEDVRRWLAREPILAHPPSALYQLRKLARRHAWPTAFAATLFVLAVAFGAWSTVQAGRLGRERDRARKAEADAEDRLRDADAARVLAGTAEATAQAEARRAEAVLDFFLDDVLALASPLQRDGRVDLAQALAQVETRLPGDFGDDPLTRAAIHFAVGRILFDLSLMDRARASQEAAVGLREAALGASHVLTIEARLALAATLVKLGETARARSILESCRDATDARSPLHWNARMRLGMTAIVEGRLADAIPELEAVRGAIDAGVRGQLDPRDVLLQAYCEAGDLERAEQAGREWLANAESQDRPQAAIGGVRIQLGRVHLMQGRIEDAEREALAAQQALSAALAPDHPICVLARILLGEVREAQGRFDEAEELFLEAHRLTREREGPASQHTVATGQMLKKFYIATDRASDAVLLMRGVLADLDAAGVTGGTSRALAQVWLADSLRAAGAPEEIEGLLEAALPGLRQGSRQVLARALGWLAQLRTGRGDCAGALALCPERLESCIGKHAPANPELVDDLEAMAVEAWLCGGIDEALSIQQRAVELHVAHRALGDVGLATAYWRAAQYHASLGEHAAARAELELAIEHAGDLDPDIRRIIEVSLAVCLFELGVSGAEPALELLAELEARGVAIPPPSASVAELRRSLATAR